MKMKEMYLCSYSEDGYVAKIRLFVMRSGTCFTGFHFPNKKKEAIRRNDRQWVYRNIPSSIHWCTEIHHDWENGGTMYLLSHEDHLVLHRCLPI